MVAAVSAFIKEPEGQGVYHVTAGYHSSRLNQPCCSQWKRCKQVLQSASTLHIPSSKGRSFFSLTATPLLLWAGEAAPSLSMAASSSRCLHAASFWFQAVPFHVHMGGEHRCPLPRQAGDKEKFWDGSVPALCANISLGTLSSSTVCSLVASSSKKESLLAH